MQQVPSLSLICTVMMATLLVEMDALVIVLKSLASIAIKIRDMGNALIYVVID